MTISYNDPLGGSPSDIGSQIRTDSYIKEALIDLVKEKFFTPLANVKSMPRNMGKKIKRYHYLPILDERNINDQGIDAAGAVLDSSLWSAWDAAGVLIGAAYADEAAALVAAGARGRVLQNSGFMYSSSKDVGMITGRIPALTENGGYVNRVGATRIEIEGTLEKFGFYDAYTAESMNFDSDKDRQKHMNTEMLRAANEITEDLLQVDLLNSTGVVRYAGIATSDATIIGEGTDVSEVTYDDLSRLEISLDNNRCPKSTKLISGSSMIDTETIDSARVMFIGSEMKPTFERMTDHFGNAAFVPVRKYAKAGSTFNGEWGAVGGFRLVVVPEMAHWASAGAAETVANLGYKATNAYYDVFPCLVVGSESFTTIGFETGGKGGKKFSIKDVLPESDVSYATDPFGEKGFFSIKWYYGFMAERTERIALIKTVARQ